MKPFLPLFVFIDACGWEIVKDTPFLQSLAPHRKRLTSVFGYSSACVPSILSGRWPSETRNWSYFVYDPENSPFRSLRGLRWLPQSVTSRRIFRRWLSKFLKTRLGFRGYFDLYNIPFRHISLFDFTEKRSPLLPGGMNRGTNIFDLLKSEGIRYHVSSPLKTEEENFVALRQDLERGEIEFAFLYWPALDGLLHTVGNKSPQIAPKLQQYERQIQELVAIAARSYHQHRLYVFSDHGMANCDELLDLKALIQQLPLRFGRDYIVVFDSTMARFWFFNEHARRTVTEALGSVPQGRIVPDDELRSLGAFFPDRYFGETIFLVREGVLIVPSDMGQRPIRGMHGYHPSEKHSYAVLCSDRPDIPGELNAIPHIYDLMADSARRAHTAALSRHQSSFELSIPSEPAPAYSKPRV